MRTKPFVKGVQEWWRINETRITTTKVVDERCENVYILQFLDSISCQGASWLESVTLVLKMQAWVTDSEGHVVLSQEDCSTFQRSGWVIFERDGVEDAVFAYDSALDFLAS